MGVARELFIAARWRTSAGISMKRAINAGRSNVDKWYLTVNDSIEHFLVDSIHVQGARQGLKD
jgi:hypothetical protein